jgi:hypothetical protein
MVHLQRLERCLALVSGGVLGYFRVAVPTLHRLVGVYQAEGSLVGEIGYVVGKLLGTRECALCDITHGGLREKPEFRACRERFAVPIETMHLDERDADVAAFTEGKTPCVVAKTDSGFLMLLDADALARCRRDVGRFEATLRQALRTNGINLS